MKITAPHLAALVAQYTPSGSRLSFASHSKSCWRGICEERISLTFDEDDTRTAFVFTFHTTQSGRLASRYPVALDVTTFPEFDHVAERYKGKTRYQYQDRYELKENAALLREFRALLASMVIRGTENPLYTSYQAPEKNIVLAA